MAFLRRSSLHLLHRHVARRYASSTTSGLTVGIRREDPLRIWERRCPLTPGLVNELVEKDGVNVFIEDCDRRVWNTSAFVEVCTTSYAYPGFRLPALCLAFSAAASAPMVSLFHIALFAPSAWSRRRRPVSTRRSVGPVLPHILFFPPLRCPPSFPQTEKLLSTRE